MINQEFWHDEKATYRAVTGQTSNFPNSDGTLSLATLPTKGTIPKAVTKTGTISSSGTVVMGTGTLFFGEGIKVGDFLYNGDAEVRRIVAIISDTYLELEEGFPSNLSGADVKVCERQTFVMIQAESTGTSAAEIQEAPFAVGSRIINGGAPLAYDASASNAQISFTVSR